MECTMYCTDFSFFFSFLLRALSRSYCYNLWSVACVGTARKCAFPMGRPWAEFQNRTAGASLGCFRPRRANKPRARNQESGSGQSAIGVVTFSLELHRQAVPADCRSKFHANRPGTCWVSRSLGDPERARQAGNRVQIGWLRSPAAWLSNHLFDRNGTRPTTYPARLGWMRPVTSSAISWLFGWG
ncbi:hypothetical protein L209DRAFT_520977 [Thermothelomyces heterothallicus CBS 203.75]